MCHFWAPPPSSVHQCWQPPSASNTRKASETPLWLSSPSADPGAEAKYIFLTKADNAICYLYDLEPDRCGFMGADVDHEKLRLDILQLDKKTINKNKTQVQLNILSLNNKCKRSYTSFLQCFLFLKVKVIPNQHKRWYQYKCDRPISADIGLCYELYVCTLPWCGWPFHYICADVLSMIPAWNLNASAESWYWPKNKN